MALKHGDELEFIYLNSTHSFTPFTTDDVLEANEHHY